MRLHSPDALSLGLGLAILLAGIGGLAGWLDLRVLAQGWLPPALTVALGLGVVAGTLRRRH